MRRFIDLPTRKKLLSAFSLFAVLMAVLIGISSWLLLSTVQAQRKIYRDDLTPVIRLEEVDSEFHRLRSRVLEMAMTGRNIEEGIADLDSTVTAVLEDLAAVEQAIAGDAKLQALYREYRETYDAFRQTRKDLLFPALREGRTQDVLNAVTGIQDQRYERISALADEMIEIASANAAGAMERARDSAFAGVGILIALGLVAIAFSLYVTSLLTRLITQPLHRLGAQAHAIAAGDLSLPEAGEERGDEFGDLDAAFAQMVRNLREINRELQGGINVLASSGNQILAATTEMASGATQTAAAVNETTATVEEVKQTAHLAAEKSRHVAETAQQAVQDALSGREAVDESIDGMRQITGQMEAVTDSIVRLSELGQAIGDIINTVNDLAEQSNLLAVNAAIEAAKAGEHGKGFAVVAQEVRHLAGQSKQATAQVRGLLGDIQKATSASVMATEQGAKAVESGMRQTSRAGEAIRMLAETVEEAASAAQQIAASSKEQLVGMDQIALAMQNIKTATDQQVTGTRQTEEASLKLNELGSRLKEMAARFRV